MPPRRPLPLPDLLLLLAGLLMLFFAPHNVAGDGALRFQALQRLMEEGTLTPMKYSCLLPLAASPFYLLGKLVMDPQWWVSRANLFFFSGFLVFLAQHLRTRLEGQRLGAFLLALTLCSMLPHHLLGFHGEVLTLCLAGSGLLLLTSRPVLASLLLALAVVNTPAAILGVALAAGFTALRTRTFMPLLAPMLGACGMLAENLLLRGGLFVTGYAGEHGFATLLPYSGQPGFSYPFLLGLYAILFSSGKGVLFFAPGLWLLRKDTAPAAWLWFLAGLAAIYSSWWAWYGGFFWGPRFFVFASLPASLALARALGHEDTSPLRNLLALAVLLLSAWVGLSGLIFGQNGLDICKADNYALEHLCWFVPEFSPLARPFVAGLPWGALRLGAAAFFLLVTLRLAWPLLRRLCLRRIQEDGAPR